MAKAFTIAVLLIVMRLTVSCPTVTAATPQVVFIDGVKSDTAVLNALPIDSIERIAVLNRENATKKYGKAGNNGVLDVYTTAYARKKHLDTNPHRKSGKPDNLVMPAYPGGDIALMEFIAHNVKYPKDARKEKIQGRVIVQFKVDKTGKMSETRLVRSVHPSLDREALRVISLLNETQWIPGTIDGEAADIWYALPITFRL